MNAKLIRKNWKQLKSKIGQQWNKFSEDEIEKIQGHYHRLIKLLEKKYEYTKEQAEDVVSDFMDNMKDKGVILQKRGRKLISNHPGKSIGTALAVGASLVLLLQRALRQR